MALVVEDGTGKVDAESYASLAEYDAYLVAFSLTDADADPAKESRLREATEYLDLEYGELWTGDIANEGTETGVDGQALDWPRSFASYSDGRAIGNTMIPIELKRAQILLAFAAKTISLMPDIAASSSGSLVAEEVALGPLKVRERFTDSGREDTSEFVKADRYIAPLILGGGSVGYLERG